MQNDSNFFFTRYLIFIFTTVEVIYFTLVWTHFKRRKNIVFCFEITKMLECTKSPSINMLSYCMASGSQKTEPGLCLHPLLPYSHVTGGSHKPPLNTIRKNLINYDSSL